MPESKMEKKYFPRTIPDFTMEGLLRVLNVITNKNYTVTSSYIILAWDEFAKSCAMRATMVCVPMSQVLILRANVPISLLTCQRRANLACQRVERCANFSTSPAKRLINFLTIF